MHSLGSTQPGYTRLGIAWASSTLLWPSVSAAKSELRRTQDGMQASWTAFFRKRSHKRSGSSTKGDLLQKNHSLTLVFEKSIYQEKCYIKNRVQKTKKPFCYFSVQVPPCSCFLSLLRRGMNTLPSSSYDTWSFAYLRKKRKCNNSHLSLYKYCLCWNISRKSIPLHSIQVHVIFTDDFLCAQRRVT